MEFPEDRKLMLILEDSVVAREKSEEMVQLLEGKTFAAGTGWLFLWRFVCLSAIGRQYDADS